MKTIQPVVFCLLILCQFGCTTPVYNYSPSKKAVSQPAIGTTNTAYVGETILTQGILTESDAIYFSRDIKPPFHSTTFTRGWYLKRGESPSHEFYGPFNDYDSGNFVVAGGYATPFEVIAIDKSSRVLYGLLSSHQMVKLGDSSDYSKQKYIATRATALQQSLMYNGKVGNKINIAYREFSNGVARPAFNNEVEYDLSESNVIGYKGAVLEVVHATNQELVYKVIRNF